MHIVQVILEFSIVLGIMVLIHELGHFTVAKLCGVRIEAFSIGFGPRIFGIRYKGTEYKLCALPLGGYVKMAGEVGAGYSAPGTAAEPVREAIDILGIDINPALDRAGSFNPADNSGDFTAQSRFNRVLIALAGPFSNFILSFFLLTLVAHYHNEVDQYLNGPAVVDYVPKNTPAAQDGLVAGDTIVQFDDIRNPTWNQILTESQLDLNRTLPIVYTHNGQDVSATLPISTGDNGTDFSRDSMDSIGLLPREQASPVGVQSVTGDSPAERAGLRAGDQVARIDNLDLHSVYTLLAYLRDANGATSHLLVLRKGQPIDLVVTPEKMEVAGAATQYRIGFAPVLPPVDVNKLPLGAAIKQSLKDNRDDSTLILRVLKGLFTRHVSVKQMSGPVGIAQDIDIATKMGVWQLMKLMSVISLNLGIFNLLPIPILDGGMILFLLIESIMRRDVNMEVKERVYQVAFVCIILFAFFVLFNDISKLHIGRP
jgi:regulator of sigma E protease